MNKALIVLLFLAFIKNGKCQSSWADGTFYKDCRVNEIDWDTLSFKHKLIKYAFIAKSYQNTNPNGKHTYYATIILSIDKNEFDSVHLAQLVSQIGDRVKVRKLVVFRNCIAHNIYISATGPKNDKQRNYLRENYIGNFNTQQEKL